MENISTNVTVPTNNKGKSRQKERRETEPQKRETKNKKDHTRRRDFYTVPKPIDASKLVKEYKVEKPEQIRKMNFNCVVKIDDVCHLEKVKKHMVNGSVSLPLCGLAPPVEARSNSRVRLPDPRTAASCARPGPSSEKIRKRRLNVNTTSTKKRAIKQKKLDDSINNSTMDDLFGSDDDDFQVTPSYKSYRNRTVDAGSAGKVQPAQVRTKPQNKNDTKRKRSKKPDWQVCSTEELVRKYVPKKERNELEKHLNRVNNQNELKPLFKQICKKNLTGQERDNRDPRMKQKTSSKILSKNSSSGLSIGDGRQQQHREQESYQQPVQVIQKRKREAHQPTLQHNDFARTQFKNHSVKKSSQSPSDMMIRRQQMAQEKQFSKIQAKNKKESLMSRATMVTGDNRKVLLQRTSQDGDPRTYNHNKKSYHSSSSSISHRSISLDSPPRSDLTSIVVQPKSAPRKRVAHAPSIHKEFMTTPVLRANIVKSDIKSSIRQYKLKLMFEECMKVYDGDYRMATATAYEAEEKAAEGIHNQNTYFHRITMAIKNIRKENNYTKETTPANTTHINGQQRTKPSSPIARTNGNNHSPKPAPTNGYQHHTSTHSIAKFNFGKKPPRVAHGSTPSNASRSTVNTGPSSTYRTNSHYNSNSNHERMQDVTNGRSSSSNSLVERMDVRVFHKALQKYLMTKEELEANGYPRPSDTPGQCCFKDPTGQRPIDTSNRKVCIRCTKEFILNESTLPDDDDDGNECIYHSRRPQTTKVGSNYEKRYGCCSQPIGSTGCAYSNTHVHDDNKRDCRGYVQTGMKKHKESKPAVYSIDCEMCYTVVGFELTRVSMVSHNCEVVYDRFVKPKGRVLDYNTKFSGVVKEDLINCTTTIEDVQRHLLRRISADTILVGHSLESDLVALKMVHDKVVDTSIVFPHRRGPPLKRALRNLMIDHLGRIIQSADAVGHDSTEDANACIELMRWKIKQSPDET